MGNKKHISSCIYRLISAVLVFLLIAIQLTQVFHDHNHKVHHQDCESNQDKHAQDTDHDCKICNYVGHLSKAGFLVSGYVTLIVHNFEISELTMYTAVPIYVIPIKVLSNKGPPSSLS
ncbi:MAG: hypothetical protein ACTJHT_14550 [Sphingobacterium sp.]|uniref:hypothetical protein n=1 Tax=Sphingobacterium sp. JB170 TaxID=1434842 RepID=UPI000B34AEC0|nr:hypothetical protein [Sphingobacterium sp. JB170]